MNNLNLRPEELERYRQLAKGQAHEAVPKSQPPALDAPLVKAPGDSHTRQSSPAGQGPLPDSRGAPHSDHDTRLADLRRAPDLETLFGLDLGDYWHPLRLFHLIDRGYRAGAASYREIVPMLRDPLLPLLADSLARRVAESISRRQRGLHSQRALHDAVRELEQFLGTPLVHRRGEGLACDRLTEGGRILARLIETYLRQYCQP
jgi:hypothetical protein